MVLKFFLKKRLWPSLKQEDDSLVYWRERILFTMLACGLVLSPVALPPSFVLIIREGFWSLAVVNLFATAGTVVFLFSRKLSYRFRAGGTLLIIYTVGLSIITNAGMFSGGPCWLFTFSVLAGLLLGLRAAWVSIVINLVTLGALWYGVSHEIFGDQFQFFSSSERALAAFVSFMILNVAAAVSAAVLVKGLETTNRRQKEVTALLEQEAEALRQSEEKFRTTLKGSPDAITITRRSDGRFVEVNDGFIKMSGYTREEVIGKAPLELGLIVSLSDREAFERKLEEEGEVDGFEMQYRTKSGVIKDTLLAARPLIYENEACLVAVVKDISQMKQTAHEKSKLEKQLHQAQKMESMGTLAGGIAHDFNNLLMGIQGRVSLMLMDKDPSYPDFEHLKGIEDYIQNAVTLTRQLLGFARGGKYEVKPSNINDLVEKSAEMFGRTRKEIIIRSRYHEKIWTVEVDQGQINQVLMNLYVNAWQAMPGGGTLILETDNVVLDEKYVKPFSITMGNYIKISITDTGTGMDQSTQKRIFDPFFTTKEMGRGTGLGLASAYGIIKNHGGIINVYSEKGQGTTFNIYLPESKSAVVESKSGLKVDIRSGSETLLFVDDEAMIIDTAEELLNSLGYKVLTANGGKEAVRLYEKKRDRIDAVILDMIMPDMSGGDTFDRLKAINPSVKVILSSGYAMNGHAEDIMNRGCDAFIQKPYNVKELTNKLAEVLS